MLAYKIIACYLAIAALRSCFSVTPEKNHKIDIHYLFTWAGFRVNAFVSQTLSDSILFTIHLA